MSRRKASAVVALLALVALGLSVLPGCTRDPSDVLRFMIWGSPEEVAVVQGFLRDFKSEHPDIHVQVEVAPPFGYRDKLQILFLGGNPPDVMYLDQDHLPAFADRGWLLDLEPYLERDRAEVDPEDFYRETFERFRYGDGLYGVCKDFTTLVLYYNKDLFDKWDVPYPKPGWTWDDFLDTAQRLTRGGDYGFLMETWPEELFPWVHQAGGRVSQDDPPEWLMGKPEHVDRSAEGLQFLADLVWRHKVAPSPSVTRDQQGNALFLRGKAAMCTYGRWACMEFKNIKDFDWDTVELPRGRERATSTFAVCYAAAAQTPKAEKAWTLIKFLTSKQAQQAVGNSGQAIPSRKSVANSPAFLDPAAFEGLGFEVDSTSYLDSIPYGHFSPRFRTAAEAKMEFSRGVEPLWNGTRRDAKELLIEIQPRLEKIVAESRVAPKAAED